VPRRAVGLDIGTFAVRAAEVTLGAKPTLTRYGQVALAPGAMDDGEIADIDAVAAAIRRLWTEGGFRGRDVVIGVANQRVIVRQADLPDLSDDELRSALQFEAQELIPIPVEDAVLDFQVLERISSAEGEPQARILLAAAQRDMVRNAVAAVERAGLSPAMVDLVPFALIRSLRDEDRAGPEAIVSIGGGVTNVVVHEGGVPRFVRILMVGGDELTRAVAEGLDVDLDTAEDLKRRGGEGDGDPAAGEAARIVEARMSPLVEEVRGSLDFYRAQQDSEPLERVLLTGGGSLLPGLVERLGAAVAAPVELARPLEHVTVGRLPLSAEQLAAAEPMLAVPIGLALARTPIEGARRMSLLPSEVAVVREQRRQMVLTGAGVGALVLLLMLLWLGRGAQLSDARRDADEAEAVTADLQTQVQALGDASGLDREIAQRRQAITNLLAEDVAWTRLLQEIATVIPNDVWLTSFTGRAGPPSEVTFAAQGFDQTSTARWLLRMGELESFRQLWVPSSTKGGEGGLVTFSSTAQLTEAARSDRLARYIGGPQ
jgi:type IV pilus assembly protein PilM